jgi:hypothetical protein
MALLSKSVDQIISGFTKTVTQLGEAATRNFSAQAAANQTAAEASANAQAFGEEGLRAEKLAANIAKMLEV